MTAPAKTFTTTELATALYVQLFCPNEYNPEDDEICDSVSIRPNDVGPLVEGIFLDYGAEPDTGRFVTQIAARIPGRTDA